MADRLKQIRFVCCIIILSLASLIVGGCKLSQVQDLNDQFRRGEVLRSELHGKGQIFLSDRVYAFTKPLLIDQPGTTILGDGAVLRFQGDQNSKLLRILSSDVTIRDLHFDGDYRQVFGGLVYLDQNVRNVVFENCSFRNVQGSGVGKGPFVTNQYAVLIHPAGGSSRFINCSFLNISNENTSSQYKEAAVGHGYAGGVFFYPESLRKPLKPVVQGTEALFDGCIFKNIRTVLDAGLTDELRIALDDADAIRTYSERSERLDLTVRNCSFRNVSKRAIKLSGTLGGVVENCIVIDDSLASPMTSIIKLSSDNRISGLMVVTPAERPVRHTFQSHSAQNITIENVSVDNAVIFYNSAPTKGTALLDNISLRQINCRNCRGGVVNSTLPAEVRDAVQEDVVITNQTGLSFFGHESFIAIGGESENRWKNITVNNGWVKIAGQRNQIDSLHLEVECLSDQLFPLPTRKLLEAFGNKRSGTDINSNRINGLTVVVGAVDPTYFSAKREDIILLYGAGNTFENLSLTFPTSFRLSALQLLGDETRLNKLNLSSGTIRVGDRRLISSGIELKNLTRGLNNNIDIPFLTVDNVQNVRVDAVREEREVTGPIILFNGSTGRAVNIVNSQNTSVAVQQTESTVIVKTINKDKR